MSALWRKSRAHCSRRVAIRAQLRLKPRLINQRALHTRELGAGVNLAGAVIWNGVPFADAASCCDIWDKRVMVMSPESGFNVL
jgi:predicted membrane protein